ncbi:restriction endonuclease subunit S [Snodgrassella alvi]|nr:restriction endonuclease subunit S [Snodgrassella alvi]
MSKLISKRIDDLAFFNPSEKIVEGQTLKKIPMENLNVWSRKITGFVLGEYKSGSKFRNNDVLVAKITPCLENGKTAYVDILDENEVAFGSTEFIVLRPKEGIDSNFLYYLAISPTFRKRAISCMEGTSGRKRVNESTLKLYDILLPQEKQQKKIANVLLALDKKIELNNRINAELEAMAKTLYDYWFVQFDFPNEEGKPYKSSGGKMVYNTTLKREIPEGWKDVMLSDISNITMGQSPDGTSYNESGDGIIFFQGATDFNWRFPSVRQYTTKPNRLAKKGDILLSVRAPVGDINIADNACCIGRGLAALNSRDTFGGFLFYVMKYFKTVFDRRNSEGTTFGSITKDDLYSLLLAYPPVSLLTKYENIVSHYNKLILAKSLENKQLIKLRDFLLPMLMNGQVTIK